MAIIIELDPGHGGTEYGAVNGNLIEKNMNLITALKAKETLEKYNIIVKMTRTTDKNVSLYERAEIAKKDGLTFSSHVIIM